MPGLQSMEDALKTSGAFPGRPASMEDVLKARGAPGMDELAAASAEVSGRIRP